MTVKNPNPSPATRFTSETAPRGAPKGNKNAAKYGKWKRALDTALAEYEDSGRGIVKGGALQAMAADCVKDAFSSDPTVRFPARNEIANRLDGKPKEHVELEYTDKLAEELTDEQLLEVIRGRSGGGEGTATPPAGATDDSSVH